jgi:hypothetical protein
MSSTIIFIIACAAYLLGWFIVISQRNIIVKKIWLFLTSAIIISLWAITFLKFLDLDFIGLPNILGWPGFLASLSLCFCWAICCRDLNIDKMEKKEKICGDHKLAQTQVTS